MKKYKKIIITIFIIFIIIGIIILIRRPKDYIISYTTDNININESYIKDKKTYILYATYNDKVYDIVIPNKFLHTKKLVKNVKALIKDNYSCLLFKTEDLDIYPVCYLNDERIDYTLLPQDEEFYTNQNIKSINDAYKLITINNTLNKNFIIWNHYGYDFINNSTKKEIKLFKKESYFDNYSFQIGEYVVIPNIDENYYFKTFNTINLKTGSTSIWKVNKEISYDFYLLGVFDNKAYIVDRKNKIEYEIDPKKEKIEIVSNGIEGKIYDNGWEEIRLNKLVNTEYKFNYNDNIEYVLDNKKIYMKYCDNETRILISNNNVDKIISSNEKEVYYISQDKLYYYSPKYGEIALMEYSEWAFNEKNTVYIY